MIFLTCTMIIFSYLLGSLSSALWICNLLNKPDPRSEGSGNPGATNILRLHGISIAVCVLLFDVAKGALPVFISYQIGIDPLGLGFIAIGACMGHIAPVFYQFKGGKGVATALGAIAPIDPWLTAWVCLTWGTTLGLSRYSSVAAFITACLTPFYTEYFDDRFTGAVTMLCLIIIICHKKNYVRLSKGFEDKVF